MEYSVIKGVDVYDGVFGVRHIIPKSEVQKLRKLNERYGGKRLWDARTRGGKALQRYLWNLDLEDAAKEREKKD